MSNLSDKAIKFLEEANKTQDTTGFDFDYNEQKKRIRTEPKTQNATVPFDTADREAAKVTQRKQAKQDEISAKRKEEEAKNLVGIVDAIYERVSTGKLSKHHAHYTEEDVKAFIAYTVKIKMSGRYNFFDQDASFTNATNTTKSKRKKHLTDVEQIINHLLYGEDEHTNIALAPKKDALNIDIDDGSDPKTSDTYRLLKPHFDKEAAKTGIPYVMHRTPRGLVIPVLLSDKQLERWNKEFGGKNKDWATFSEIKADFIRNKGEATNNYVVFPGGLRDLASYQTANSKEDKHLDIPGWEDEDSWPREYTIRPTEVHSTVLALPFIPDSVITLLIKEKNRVAKMAHWESMGAKMGGKERLTWTNELAQDALSYCPKDGSWESIPTYKPLRLSFYRLYVEHLNNTVEDAWSIYWEPHQR